MTEMQRQILLKLRRQMRTAASYLDSYRVSVAIMIPHMRSQAHATFTAEARMLPQIIDEFRAIDNCADDHVRANCALSADDWDALTAALSARVLRQAAFWQALCEETEGVDLRLLTPGESRVS